MRYDHPAAAAYAEFWSAVRSSQPQPPAANASAAVPGQAGGSAELAGVLRRADLAEAAASLLAARLRDERVARSLRAFEARAARERASAAAEALRREKAERAALQRQLAKERAEKEALEERATELERLLKAERAAGEDAQRPAHSEAPRVVSYLNSEHELLLVALGAEASKVAALAGALRGAGGDPDALIGRLEEEWEREGAGCRP
ncbi:hypothetical protein GPECTOR_15g490 [Gonium pectorale]|uniref:Uncharacterized protein n=1 Tax=Gonium pectorale TaxID=33097 RepID=A0A150GLX4_GONPE|nr:hypothetical protein GPECTOR_15g490 [Gonium pectorale]|eukprot:KXZ50804.1 hypothetical protein GPECTOR_15g490 [Gonium pectorale]